MWRVIDPKWKCFLFSLKISTIPYIYIYGYLYICAHFVAILFQKNSVTHKNPPLTPAQNDEGTFWIGKRIKKYFQENPQE